MDYQKRLRHWSRYPLNLLSHFKWTGCEHKRRKLVKYYLSECVDCGAVFDDGQHTIDDLESAEHH